MALRLLLNALGWPPNVGDEGTMGILALERITRAVLGNTLAAGFNRYAPYIRAVAADPCAVYVLPTGSPMAAAFARRPPPRGVTYIHATFHGYDVYSPCRRVMP